MRNSLSTFFEPDTQVAPVLKIFNKFLPTVLGYFYKYGMLQYNYGERGRE
jgi:hypothetical protein